MSERDEIIKLIRRALAIGNIDTIDRALAAAKRYLDRHPDDWQLATACEPLVLMRSTLDNRQIRS